MLLLLLRHGKCCRYYLSKNFLCCVKFVAIYAIFSQNLSQFMRFSSKNLVLSQFMRFFFKKFGIVAIYDLFSKCPFLNFDDNETNILCDLCQGISISYHSNTDHSFGQRFSNTKKTKNLQKFILSAGQEGVAFCQFFNSLLLLLHPRYLVVIG